MQYDNNNAAERRPIAIFYLILVAWGWVCCAFGVRVYGTWVWKLGSVATGADGGWDSRWDYLFGASLPTVIIAAVVVWFRMARDLEISKDEARENARAMAQAAAEEKAAVVHSFTQPARASGFDGLTLGLSTGFLAGRGHSKAIQRGATVHLSANDVCKNIFIAGGIGAGKTTRMINPILQQVLNQDCSALIFDIKGDFRREVDFIASRTGRSYVVVGDGGKTLNLLKGCTPEVAASYLKSCFTAGGSAQGDGAFWAETATNYCRNLLSLIQLAGFEYSIAGLADLVFSEEKRMDALKSARDRELSGEFDKRAQRVWAATLGYMVETVNKWDDKFRGNVQGTCEAVLNPFVSPDLVDAFSSESEHGEADLYDLLNSPSIYLVNLPRHKFGANGARFAYLLIKLRFFTMMAERRANLSVNQDRYVAFFCDEYQGIVDAISDTDFWDKSRSSKCFGVLSMQGVSSLVKAVGDERAANAILQNWRQRVMFRNEDQATIETVQRMLGQVDVRMVGESFGENSGESVSQNAAGGGGSISSSTGSSYGQNVSFQRQNLFDAGDWRLLSDEFAMFVGNIGTDAADEVIETSPIYVN